MNNRFIPGIVLLFCMLPLRGQDTVPKYSGELVMIFTGEVKNQFDSVFRMEYVLDAMDLQYDVEETIDLQDSTSYVTSEILLGKYKNIRKEGNKVHVDMGLFVPGKPLPPLEYKDNQGKRYKVALKAPWGEIQDVELYNSEHSTNNE